MRMKIITLIMLSVFISYIPAWANLTNTEVSQLYVSIFGRASEGEGNHFWQTLELDMATTADVMLDTDAARNYFGANLNTNQAFIEHIYRNTLNKTIADDFDGISYWVNMLNAGTSRGEVVATLVEAINDYAPGGPYYNPDDSATVAAFNQFMNRVEVSNYMAENVYATPDDWETSTSFSHGMVVTDDPATVFAAETIINGFAPDSDPENPITFPFSDTANRPANINPGTVITTDNHGTWVITEGSYYAGTQRSETAYFYEENNHIKMSYMDSGVSFTVALIEGDSENPNTFPFLDTVNRPANINPDTVITTENHGMWIITEGSYYAGTQRFENAYFYEENNHIIISYKDCGVTFSVVEMPDTAPTMSSTMRPGNMNPGTILILDNGQIWKITEGNYYGGTTKREDVIVYLMNGNYHMSFQISGVTMKVEQIIAG